MFKHEMMPVIEIDDLEDAIKEKYNYEFKHNLRQLLFDTGYMNDVFVRYWFDEDLVWEGKPWQNESHIEEENIVRRFLREHFKGEYDAVLVDVCW